MMMPSIFRDSLFDRFMDDPLEDLFHWNNSSLLSGFDNNHLKTDIKEVNGNYELDMELPGFKKEDLNAKLEDGYLTISASKNSNNDVKDDNGNYIRKERYSGSCSRTFYVGNQVRQEDIKAKFEDSVLHLSIPNLEDKPAIENNRYITIEG